MRNLFELYRRRLDGWTVRSQAPMSWHAERDSPFLPGLIPDLRFQHRKTARLVVLDTKFTASSTVTSRMGNKGFDSNHIYQIYAYLRSQEEGSVRFIVARPEFSSIQRSVKSWMKPLYFRDILSVL